MKDLRTNNKTQLYIIIEDACEDGINDIEEQVMPTDAIMEFLGFENPHYLVEPGAWYLERNFVAYNSITGLLVIEVRKSLNI